MPFGNIEIRKPANVPKAPPFLSASFNPKPITLFFVRFWNLKFGKGKRISKPNSIFLYEWKKFLCT